MTIHRFFNIHGFCIALISFMLSFGSTQAVVRGSAVRGQMRQTTPSSPASVSTIFNFGTMLQNNFTTNTNTYNTNSTQISNTLTNSTINSAGGNVNMASAQSSNSGQTTSLTRMSSAPVTIRSLSSANTASATLRRR